MKQIQKQHRPQRRREEPLGPAARDLRDAALDAQVDATLAEIDSAVGGNES